MNTYRRDEGGLKLLIQELLPGEVSEPRVVFNLRWAIDAKAVGRLPLNQLK